MQTYCANCSAILDLDAHFCSECRAPVTISTTINCPSCRKANQRGAKFCKYCAFNLNHSAPSVTRVTTNVTPIITNEVKTPIVPTSPQGLAKLFRLGGEDKPTILPVLAWGVVGIISGILSAISEFTPLSMNYLPGIIFGIAVYLFGEYSSLQTRSKQQRIISFVVIIIASTIGWFLALKVHASPSLLGASYLEAFLSNLTGTEIRLSDTQEFLLSGFIGGTFLVSAELICWRLNFQGWVYVACVVAVASLAGLIVMPFSIITPGIFIIWQTVVLTFHAIMGGNSRRWIIPSTMLLFLLAVSISGTFVLFMKVHQARSEKEQAETRLREAEEERRLMERSKEEADKSAAAAQKRADEEAGARMEATAKAALMEEAAREKEEANRKIQQESREPSMAVNIRKSPQTILLYCRNISEGASIQEESMYIDLARPSIRMQNPSLSFLPTTIYGNENSRSGDGIPLKGKITYSDTEFVAAWALGTVRIDLRNGTLVSPDGTFRCVQR